MPPAFLQLQMKKKKLTFARGMNVKMQQIQKKIKNNKKHNPFRSRRWFIRANFLQDLKWSNPNAYALGYHHLKTDKLDPSLFYTECSPVHGCIIYHLSLFKVNAIAFLRIEKEQQMGKNTNLLWDMMRKRWSTRLRRPHVWGFVAT